MVPSLEKERKKKKSSRKLTENLGEQVKPKKSSKKKMQLVNGHTDVIEHVADKAQDKVKDQVESDMEGSHDSDALNTMNAILEYNRKLMQKLNELEDQKDSIKDPEKTAEDTAQDTMKEVKDEKKEAEDKGRSNYSFELPIGDIMKSYGSMSTSELPNREPKKEYENETVTANKNTSEPHKACTGEAEKDDIVVKVDATRDGITLTIHIPRN